MTEKEKLLAQKIAEVEALKREIAAQSTAAEKGKSNKGVFKKIIVGGLALFVGIPLLVAAISEAGMTPEDKAIRKAEQAEKLATAKTQREQRTKETQVAALIAKLEAAVKAENTKSLVQTAESLEKIAPERIKDYENEIKNARAKELEILRVQKLNDTGNFYIGNYVDEFGDKTGKKFVGYKGNGTFSNSATEGSRLAFWVAMNSTTKFDISLYEYAGKNPVKDIFGEDEYVIRFRYSDTTSQVTCKNAGDRISCGPSNSSKLHAALKVAGKVKFSIYNRRTTSSQYSFEVNANGYTNAIRKLQE